jgi:hypothetical protein
LVPTIDAVNEATPHIGTLREKPLHASLKRWYALPGDRVEVPVGEFVIDLVRDTLLIEIQTRGFSGIKGKITTLLGLGHRVRIVHPIPIDRWIVKVDADGTILSRRRSPKHGRTTDVFTELVSFPDLLRHSHLEVDVIMTNEEEYRRHSLDVSWRRKGWTVMERRLIDVVDTLLISTIDDLAALLPTGLPEPFTTSNLATELSGSRRAAQQMAYCLREVGVIAVVGKRGNALEYRVT